MERLKHDLSVVDIQRLAGDFCKKYDIGERNIREALYEGYCAGFLKAKDLDPPDDWIRVLREDAENP